MTWNGTESKLSPAAGPASLPADRRAAHPPVRPEGESGVSQEMEGDARPSYGRPTHSENWAPRIAFSSDPNTVASGFGNGTWQRAPGSRPIDRQTNLPGYFT